MVHRQTDRQRFHLYSCSRWCTHRQTDTQTDSDDTYTAVVDGAHTDRQTDRQRFHLYSCSRWCTHRQTDRQTDRQRWYLYCCSPWCTGRQTDRQTHRQTGRQTDSAVTYTAVVDGVKGAQRGREVGFQQLILILVQLIVHTDCCKTHIIQTSHVQFL